jgi:hypothetical protein
MRERKGKNPVKSGRDHVDREFMSPPEFSKRAFSLLGIAAAWTPRACGARTSFE